MRGVRAPVEVRFWEKVRKGDPLLCWNWTAVTRSGYGQISSGGAGGTMLNAHRVSYEIQYGPIPLGLEIDHLCRNRLCVNPAHLEAVTRRENCHRSPIAPTAINARKTRCPQGHPYAGENLYVTRAGVRQCKICRRLRCREWYWRKRAREAAS